MKIDAINMNNQSGNHLDSPKIKYYLNKDGKIDSFETHNQNKNKKLKAVKTGIIATVLAGMTALGIHSSTSNVVTLPVTNTTNIEDLSDTYGVSTKAIIDYNEKHNNNPLEVKIPSKFSVTEEKEKELNEKLHRRFISEETRLETENELKEIRSKKDAQDFLAETYCDDDFIYFRLHLNGKTSTPNSNTVIPADNFKQVFGIKDGALKDYNELDFKWKSNKFSDVTGQYQDYTNAMLKDGETYRIKKSDLK